MLVDVAAWPTCWPQHAHEGGTALIHATARRHISAHLARSRGASVLVV